MFKSLFYFANNAISGANSVLNEIMQRLESAGQSVDAICDNDSMPEEWQPVGHPFLRQNADRNPLAGDYDFIIVSKAFLLPSTLQQTKHAIPVLLPQEIEDFNRPAMREIFSLPIPILATSGPMRAAIAKATAREPLLLPLAVDRALFRPVSNAKAPNGPKRILMVGDYLRPEKSMLDGFAAIEKLSQDFDLQLVLITQRQGSNEVIDTLPFPVEVHHDPRRSDMPFIYSSCDVYCSSSHFENFPLPGLEAFNCGVPVVSTDNPGIFSYGEDDVNVLLARVGDSDHLSAQLRRLLTSPELAARLVARAFETAKRFDWDETFACFVRFQQEIKNKFKHPLHINQSHIQRLVYELEKDGLYIPASVRSSCKIIFAAMRTVCDDLVADKVRPAEALERLVLLRSQLEPYVHTETTQYYESAKKRYDICGFMIALVEDEAALRQAALVGAKI